MSGRYERVNTHDEHDLESPTEPGPRPLHPIPNSPPPSFHSRASSIRERDPRVNQDLADAFDSDDSDDDADDRQRLVRGNSSTTVGSGSRFTIYESTPGPIPMRRPAPAPPQPAQPVTTQAPIVAQPTAQPLGRVYGGGIQSDGVFSNLTAKPETGDGEKDEMPPTYEQAAADAAPPYWETTILAPGLGGLDEVYIDGMPVGSFFSFIWNGLISSSFQLVGFLLTYLLHSTHAAKNGSRLGLGITLIQWGLSMKSLPSGSDGAPPSGMESPAGPDGYANPADPNAHEFDPNDVDPNRGGFSDISSSDWASYFLMILGWFIFIRAVSDYLKARRHEQLVLQSPDRGLGVPIIAEGESSERVV